MKVNVINMPEPVRIESGDVSFAEELFVHYKQGMTGSGFTALFDCIFKLDGKNRAKMAKGFPEEVLVCNRYNNERGYNKDLARRYNEKYGTQVVL